MFDRIVDHILAPLLSERMQQAVRRSLEDGGVRCQPLPLHTRRARERVDDCATEGDRGYKYGMVDDPTDGAGEALRKQGSTASLYISALGREALWQKT